MRLRHLVAAAGAAALSAAALAAPSLAAGKTPIKLSIQTEADGFSGFVKSAKTSCHSGRKVTLYRKVAGPDKKAGSDVAQPNQDGSQWKISVSRDGSYYAVVKVTSKCGGKTSKTLKSKLVDTGEDASASQGDDDGPAPVKINLKRGVGDQKGLVTGLIYSSNPDCFDHIKVTFYRKTFANSEQTSIIVKKIGFSYAERSESTPDSTHSKRFTFKPARNGTLVAKTLATDSCRAATSKSVPFTKPAS